MTTETKATSEVGVCGDLSGLVGKVIEFDYPRHNFEGVVSEYERRHLFVQSVRFTDRQPLAQATRTINPLLRRGSALVIGYDIDRRAERKFYLTSMTNLQITDEEFEVPGPRRPNYMVRIDREGLETSVVGPFTYDEAERVCDALPHGSASLIPPGHRLNPTSP